MCVDIYISYSGSEVLLLSSVDTAIIQTIHLSLLTGILVGKQVGMLIGGLVGRQ